MNDTVTLGRRPSGVATRPRLGFAGVGWIGRNRFEAIAQSGFAEVASIYDPVAEAATKAREIAPDAEQPTSYAELLESDIDAVVIATPSALHAEQAIAALRRGKAVFCQKPLARNAVETREVVAAARAADRLLRVDLSYRFTTGMQRIRERIRSGALGRIYAIEAVFHNAYGPNKTWFYDAKLSGGGCLLDLGVHLVDLALWCLDFPAVTNVVGHLLHRAPVGDPSNQVEDYAAAQLLLAGGTSVQLACSWKAPAGCDADIGLRFFGSEGGAEFRNTDGSFYDFIAEECSLERSRRVLATPPDAWGGRAAVAWCRRLADSTRFDPEAEQLVIVAETLDRIYGRTP
jgi:predicted dehydrogenase